MTKAEQFERWYYESLISKSLLGAVMAAVALVLGLFGFGNIEGMPGGDWFARSGAFATVANIWSAKAESSFVSRYGSTGLGDLHTSKLSPRALAYWAPKLSCINFAVGITAALVWGYGDVIYCYID